MAVVVVVGDLHCQSVRGLSLLLLRVQQDEERSRSIAAVCGCGHIGLHDNGSRESSALDGL